MVFRRNLGGSQDRPHGVPEKPWRFAGQTTWCSGETLEVRRTDHMVFPRNLGGSQDRPHGVPEKPWRFARQTTWCSRETSAVCTTDHMVFRRFRTVRTTDYGMCNVRPVGCAAPSAPAAFSSPARSRL